jgi:hypothetical protein
MDQILPEDPIGYLNTRRAGMCAVKSQSNRTITARAKANPQARPDDGPLQPALGTGSWSFSFIAGALTESDHSISVRASAGRGVFATDSVELIANSESPPVPDCAALQPGTPLPYENPIAPEFVDLPVPTTVHLEIIGHSENSGYDDDLQALLDAAPPGGHQFVVTNHWIGGQELWRWVTPGEDGYQAIEALLAGIQGPTFALILVSNNTTCTGAAIRIATRPTSRIRVRGATPSWRKLGTNSS